MNFTSKTCPTCGQPKPIDEFYRNRSRPDGRASECKICDRKRADSRKPQRRESRARWVEKNKDAEAERNRRKYQKNRDRILEQRRTHYHANPLAYIEGRYGISTTEYTRMLVEQRGACAICGEKPERLIVDHDHASGLVRELLCKNCNFALGHLRDNAELAERAATYLRAHSQTNPQLERRA